MIHDKAAIGFNRAGDAYDRGRPEYPKDAIEFLINTLQITSSSSILDLGAGTGKFTKLILPTRAKIVAVEPVEGMRKKFHSLLPDIQILAGSAESIPLEKESVDSIVVAQAFHWFNGDLALKEIHRVLKSNGRLGLIWNARDESKSWVAELTKIIDPYESGAPRYKSMNWKHSFEQSKIFKPLQLKQFSYIQSGTIETIVDRVASISFIASLDEKVQSTVLNQVRHLLLSHPDTKGSKEIHLPYQTDVYWCERCS